MLFTSLLGHIQYVCLFWVMAKVRQLLKGKKITIQCSSFFAPPSVGHLPLTVSINTFLVRHGWSDVRPIHLHPFICLYAAMEISVLVESTHAFSSNWPVNSLFLMVTSSQARKATSRDQVEYPSYVEGSLLLLFENRINTECVFLVL